MKRCFSFEVSGRLLYSFLKNRPLVVCNKVHYDGSPHKVPLERPRLLFLPVSFNDLMPFQKNTFDTVLKRDLVLAPAGSTQLTNTEFNLTCWM